jgi:hypothetical protein
MRIIRLGYGTGAQNVAAPLSPLELSGPPSPRRSDHVDPLIKSHLYNYYP